MKSTNPKVSIITAVRNNEEQIEYAIKSVLNQNYPNIEYIVVDGASTDNTIKIVSKFSGQIDKIISEYDSGIYDAMNKGILLATGDIIGLVNSDDWLDNNVIKYIVDAHSKNPDAIIYGLLKEYKNNKPWKIHATHHSFIKKRMIPHQTCFIPKRHYNALGLYDTQFKYLADYDFLLRCYLNKVSFVMLEKVISNARTGGATHSNLLSAKREQLQVLYNHSIISKTELKKGLLKNSFKTIINSIIPTT